MWLFRPRKIPNHKATLTKVWGLSDPKDLYLVYNDPDLLMFLGIRLNQIQTLTINPGFDWLPLREL